MSNALNHFVTLARRGAFRGCSGGEKRCYLLAKILREQLPGIDPTAFQGFVEFAEIAKTSHSAAVEVWNNAGYVED